MRKDFMSMSDHRKEIEDEIQKSFSNFGKDNRLVEACLYILLNGGKRIRASIVLMIAEELGNGCPVLEAAKAIEYFHTASLVADDLPCMDNDEMRRSKPSVHKIYGDDMALLVTYALIAEGYHSLTRCVSILKEQQPFLGEWDYIGMLALENASVNTGLKGIVGGQLLDLHPPVDKTEDILEKTILQKTSSLFEVAFVFGWLFGGGNLKLLPVVKEMSMQFGMAFQIVDDFEDFEQDKLQKHSANLVLAYGEAYARKKIEASLLQYKKLAKVLGLDKGQLINIVPDLQGIKIQKNAIMST